MRQLALFALFSLILPTVIAVPDSIITGPYNISFDLGLPDDTYVLLENDPVVEETLSGYNRTEYSIILANISDIYNFIKIYVISMGSKTPTQATSIMLEESLKKDYANDPSYFNFESGSRTIDNMPGAVASMESKSDSGQIKTVYVAAYLAPFDPRSTIVNILSLYPWNEGTLKLLKTIHIDKID